MPMVIGYFVFGISVISLISVQTSATNRIIPYIKLVINLNTDYNIITTTSYIFNCLSFQTVYYCFGNPNKQRLPNISFVMNRRLNYPYDST
jgi:hypothetical protein